MQDQEIPVSGEPYMKKSKLLSLAKEYLLDPLKEFFGLKKKEDDITPLEEEDDDNSLEKHWAVLQKAFDEGEITDKQYLEAREKYHIAKTNKAVETIKKAFDQDLITDDQYFDYLEKARSIHPIGAIKIFGGRNYVKTADGWKYHGKGTGVKAQAHAAGANRHNETKKEGGARLFIEDGVKPEDQGTKGKHPKKGSPVGKTITVTDPRGKKVSGMVERIALKELKHSEEHGDPAYENPTAEGYAQGEHVKNMGEEDEKWVKEKHGVTDPDHLPPLIVDKNNLIIDGNNRYRAAHYAGLKEMNVIKVDKTRDEYYGLKKKTK